MKIVDEGVLSHQVGRGAYMPVITPLSDGEFIACEHVGSGLGAPDNYIQVLHSPDGRNWTNAGSIHEKAALASHCYRGPRISELPDGRLLMQAGRFEISGDSLFNVHTEALQRPEMLVFWSRDRGRSWSQPDVVPVDLPRHKYTWNGAGTLLQIAANRWMYPLETWKPDGYEGPPDQKAMAVFSADQGRSWGDLVVVADDPTGQLLYWDQMCALLPNGNVYTLLWTHVYGTHDDLANHWTLSADQGRTWSQPRPTNLLGQVCTPIPLHDGRVLAIYNFRRQPQGIRVAVSEDLEQFDVENELVLFDAGQEATLGEPESENFLAEHLQIAFGKPGGVQLKDGTVLTYFWCTVRGVTHTRWVRLAV